MSRGRPIILFRPDKHTEEEMAVAKKYFKVVTSRIISEPGQLVIGRYSCLPYYEELENDLSLMGCRLINSHKEHLYIANFEYYADLKEFTATSWDHLDQVPKDSGSWIVKGRTNSRKQMWKTHMFAKTWDDLVRIYLDLSVDPLIGSQGIIIRKFLDLEIIEEGVSQPFFNEWRFFFYKGRFLSKGFYWTCSNEIGEIDQPGMEFAQMIADKVKTKTNFVVIDIAKTNSGEWKLIELNDGQMSGLSYNDPNELYKNLKLALEEENG